MPIETNTEQKTIQDLIKLNQQKYDEVNSIQNGTIVDSDVILKQLMDNAEFNIPMLSLNIIEIYENTTDKKMFKELFYALTGMSFIDYLKECVQETRSEEV